MIRKATEADLVRIAEIAVFVKRMNYRRIFCDEGIGAELIRYAVCQESANHLWLLEKNIRAISFYKRNGFKMAGERLLWNDTGQYIVKMVKDMVMMGDNDLNNGDLH